MNELGKFSITGKPMLESQHLHKGRAQLLLRVMESSRDDFTNRVMQRFTEERLATEFSLELSDVRFLKGYWELKKPAPPTPQTTRAADLDLLADRMLEKIAERIPVIVKAEVERLLAP